MNVSRNAKKKLIVSYKNLTDEQLELFKECYPEGHKDFLQKFVKPNGEPIFVVPLETDDASYMVKFDVKIDSTLLDDELDKGLYGDDDKDDDEFAPLSEVDKDDEDSYNHTERVLKHGSYDDVSDVISDRESLKSMAAELKDAFPDDEDEEDSYSDDEGGGDDNDDDDIDEPSADDISEIESELENFDDDLPQVEIKPKRTAKASPEKMMAETVFAKKPASKKASSPAKKTVSSARKTPSPKTKGGKQ